MVDTWLAVIDRAIRLVFCFSLVAFVAAQTVCFVDETPICAEGLALFAAMSVCMALLAALMIAHRESSWWAAGAVGGISLLYLTGPAIGGAPVIQPWWMGVAAPVVIAFIVLASPRRLVVPAAAAYILIYLTALELRDGFDTVSAAVLAGGVILAGATAIRTAAGQLRRGARLADAETNRRRAQRREEMQLSALTTQTQWVDRLLHDEVVHALRAVSLGGKVPEAEVRALATTAAARFSEAREPVDNSSSRVLDEALRRVGDACGLVVVSELERTVVPGYVARVIAAAVREALRNTRLHSGVGRATMLLRQDAGQVTVTVADDGHGFDVAATHPGHVGVSSIGQRMRDIGGSARIDSGPDGTVVQLVWRPRRSPTPHPHWVDRRLVGAQRAVATGCSAFIVLDAVQGVLKFQDLANPWPAEIATAAVVLAWAWTLKALLRGQVTRSWTTCLMLVAPSCSALAALSLPTLSRDGTDYWLACGTAPLVLVAVLLRPPRESWWGAALAVVTPVACVVLQEHDLERLIGLGPAVLAPAYVMAAAYLTVFVVGRLAGEAAREWDRTLRSMQRSVRLRCREQVLVARLHDLRDQVLPLLDAIGAGSADLQDPEIIRRAMLYEARVRDRIGGSRPQLSPAAVMALQQLRSAGAVVDTRVDEPPSTHDVALVEQGLQALADAGRPGGHITVTVRDGGFSLVATPYDEGLLIRWGSCVGADAELLSDRESFVALRRRATTAELPDAKSLVRASVHSGSIA